ncbi:DUF1223 domain-containing protein [Methylocapsa palsarum]|uniref:DUF1223 domain-containing protein n=1 Tax=Methylocapsa palsarum TaxID=1612308 RepID=A0A1I3WB99_9HYPH|nr:DUF1223 domain-containing protein [Methylocapsa palsarum]SFK04838.1 hypothetical protein SAMN05444581_101487 [Methylocapsa palsarum]
MTISIKSFILSPWLQLAAIAGSSCVLAADLTGPPTPSSAVVSVIELFTSQGCSSCPPADKLLAQIARRPDIVAVSFAVDYWDYIGWKDTLALPLSSSRQRAYAALQGGNGVRVYTPQAVIDGIADAIGGDRQEVEEAIKSTKGVDGAATLPLRLQDADDHFVVDVAAGGGGPAGIYVLRVLRARTVHIGHGENAGRNVTYTNVVRAINRIGEWTGSRVTLNVPKLIAEDEGYVVFVQRGDLDQPGAILGAVKSAGL